jgi:hypothetical protein
MPNSHKNVTSCKTAPKNKSTHIKSRSQIGVARHWRQVAIKNAGVLETDIATQVIEALNKKIIPCIFRSESHMDILKVSVV